MSHDDSFSTDYDEDGRIVEESVPEPPAAQAEPPTNGLNLSSPPAPQQEEPPAYKCPVCGAFPVTLSPEAQSLAGCLAHQRTLRADKAQQAERIAALQADLDRLHGAIFSRRDWTAMNARIVHQVERITALEQRLRQAVDAEPDDPIDDIFAELAFNEQRYQEAMKAIKEAESWPPAAFPSMADRRVFAALLDRAVKAEARIRVLTEALEEITTACEFDCGGPSTDDFGDNESVGDGDGPEGEMALTFGMIRRARAALAPSVGGAPEKAPK